MSQGSSATGRTRPDFEHLFEAAAEQQGLFTLQQAAAAGYSKELVQYHVKAGHFIRVQRGIYRLRHFPAGKQENLVAAWLWSGQVGTFTLHTALSLHDLSDVLPNKLYLTVPESWRKRRLEVPAGIVLRYDDISSQDRTWLDSVPVTSPRRTLEDCAEQGISLETLGDAVRQALSRGLVSSDEIPAALHALGPITVSARAA